MTMFRFAILFSLGIVTGDAYAHCFSLKEWLICMCVVTIAAIIVQKLSDTLCNIAITIGIVLLGTLRISIDEENNIAEIASTQNNIWEEYIVKGMDCDILVYSEPIARGKVIQFDGLANGNDIIDGEKVRVSLLRDTITKRYESIHLGSVLRCKADFSPLKDWHRKNSNFDYVRWLRTRGFVCRAFIPIGKWEMISIETAGIGVIARLIILLTSLREKLTRELSTCGMEEESFGVATAMTLGNKSGLTPELRDEYSAAGASHILALSGMHLSIIYMILIFIIGKKRRWTPVVIIIMIWAYVLFTGMPISVVRAACMLTIWEITHALERQQAPLNVVGLTIIIMEGFSPQSLWDVGFQMSIAAVTSIIIFADRFNNYMPEAIKRRSKKEEKHQTAIAKASKRVLRSFWYTATISLAAQIGTMPLIVYYFGRIPFYFLLTNFIVIPCAPVIVCGTIVLSAIVTANIYTDGLLTHAVRIIGEAISDIIAIQNKMLEHIASLPGSSIEDIEINTIQVFALYTFIICTAMAITTSNAQKR